MARPCILSAVTDPSKSPPPHSKPLPTEAIHAGRRLTEALVQVAAEHAQRGVSDSVVIGALVSALGCVSAATALAHGFDLAEYAEFLTGYLARVFDAESRKPVYH
jgi:hypothetical protein